MALEIERKYLVKSDAWRGEVIDTSFITQGFLGPVEVDQPSTRIRIREGQHGIRARITIKSRDPGISRQEFEYAIPYDDAQAMLLLCEGGTLTKNRHQVVLGDHVWEVDEMLDLRHKGLILAEIELDSIDEEFVMPEWVGKEVTGDPAYTSAALSSIKPYYQKGWEQMTAMARSIQMRHLDNHQGDVYHAMQNLIVSHGTKFHGPFVVPIKD